MARDGIAVKQFLHRIWIVVEKALVEWYDVIVDQPLIRMDR